MRIGNVQGSTFRTKIETKLGAYVLVDFGHEIRLRFRKCERGL